MQLFLLQVYVYASAAIFPSVFWRGGNPQTKARFCIQKQAKVFPKKNKEDAPLTSISPFSGLPPDYGFLEGPHAEKDFDAMPEIAR